MIFIFAYVLLISVCSFCSYVVELFLACIVSAVRLMRIQLGGAFADLLNKKGKGSGDNEMGYVERTLGFRTKDLDDRDLRLVFSLSHCVLSFPFSFLALMHSFYSICVGGVHLKMIGINFNLSRRIEPCNMSIIRGRDI